MGANDHEQEVVCTDLGRGDGAGNQHTVQVCHEWGMVPLARHGGADSLFSGILVAGSGGRSYSSTFNLTSTNAH